MVLDIGGNIGATAIYYATQFPKAKIYTVEPVPVNYSLLLKNIAPYKNIIPFNFALGAENGTFPLYYNNEEWNFGGFSLYSGRNQCSEAIAHVVEVKSVKEFLHENNINDMDIIKIDTEGAEYEILTNVPLNILRRVRWIVGELHSQQDKELIDYLGSWFDVSTNKKSTDTIGNFRAQNYNL